jgi:hypothetical protein
MHDSRLLAQRFMAQANLIDDNIPRFQLQIRELDTRQFLPAIEIVDLPVAP